MSRMRVSCRYAGTLAYLMSMTRRKIEENNGALMPPTKCVYSFTSCGVQYLRHRKGKTLSPSFDVPIKIRSPNFGTLASHIPRCKHTNANDKFAKKDVSMWAEACFYECIQLCVYGTPFSQGHFASLAGDCITSSKNFSPFPKRTQLNSSQGQTIQSCSFTLTRTQTRFLVCFWALVP